MRIWLHDAECNIKLSKDKKYITLFLIMKTKQPGLIPKQKQIDEINVLEK